MTHDSNSTTGPRLRVAALALALSVPATAAMADVTVIVQGLRSTQGALMVAACSRDAFLGPACEHTTAVPASQGRATLVDLPPGQYAIQVIHDENGNGDLDRRGMRPQEGMGFSRDAPMRFGPPRYGDAAVAVGPGDGTVTLTMRYFQ